MGKDRTSPLHQQYSHLEFPNLNFTSTIPYLRHQIFTNSYTCMASENGTLPGVEIPWLPHLKRSQGNGERQQKDFQQFPKVKTCMPCANGSLPGLGVRGLPHSKSFQATEGLERYFYTPNLCKSDAPLPDAVLNEKLCSPYTCGIETTSNVVSGSVQKAFFVFDQSEKRANLIFSSIVPSPAQSTSLGNATPIDKCCSEQKDSQATRDLIANPCPIIYEGLNENRITNEESEVHEDTEELDALLYSDDSECDEEEEETSTAHSPGKVPGWCQNQGEIEERAEEITCPVGNAMKRKSLHNEEDELLKDTASSMNAAKCENDEESSCLNGRTYGKLYSTEANKRLKRERILDTMSILQSIVPGVKGGDSGVILDEAIKYLRFLKLKAKSLGVCME